MVFANGFGDRLVSVEFFVLRRRAAPFREEKLGPQQADTFTSEVCAPQRALQSADIRDDFDALAVRRSRRFVGVGEILLAPLFGADLRAPNTPGFLRPGIEAERALAPIEHHAGAVRYLEGGWIRAGEGGQA